MRQKLKTFSIMLMCMGCFSGTALAQHEVTGKVTSAADNQPIVGVAVTAQGTSIGVATDAAGNYSLQLSSGDATLVFTFIGFATQEIAVNGREVVNVAMEEDTEQPEQVVAIGYGQARRSDRTGSVGPIRSTATVVRFPVNT